MRRKEKTKNSEKLTKYCQSEIKFAWYLGKLFRDVIFEITFQLRRLHF